ncbi:hypothetical protein P280DRAFT_478331 [Massarina eburnea CBS 473.64]|uniref:Uncharacterized protein n=1 Tax=Massarina eburnea CBS 473.64 TaxID=1395130 RepID=A0A6A6S8M8_9PLEO|nr:hypothetical protein P280DRAFT_478331 [Massarina eburnea CBS 473.64]
MVEVHSDEVELNLIYHFHRAKSWGAVLLIDEADVFLERRSTADLTRNSLVAGFLRALEWYEGIIFLTTNRVDTFGDAFISRIHVQLYYPDFDDEGRRKWNGREIRNAFQTAVALAEYEGKKDAEDRIILTDDHLRSVVEMSRDFKVYLEDVHMASEGKRAERRKERLDHEQSERRVKFVSRRV